MLENAVLLNKSLYAFRYQWAPLYNFFWFKFQGQDLTTCSLRPFTIENAKKIQNFDIFTKIWHRSWFGRIFQYIRCHPKLLIRFENSNWEYKDISYIILIVETSGFQKCDWLVCKSISWPWPDKVVPAEAAHQLLRQEMIYSTQRWS